ncbi:gliding motility-associated-like protein [Flavobacteriaceae bacterium MAR_2009_75]|nr:gliding motility-associated-like protein [Flavobacteriaceae bacterium MAR_2009_75]
MRSATLTIIILMTFTCFGQDCSLITTPVDGDVDIAVDSPIRWSAVPNIIGFVVSLGTTPGGGEIVNRRSSGQNNFYIPEVGLPADTKIYVTIGYFKAGQDFTTCEIESFRTVKITEAPNCTSLKNPINNSSNIAAETQLDWLYSPTATGYILSIGTSAGGTDVLDGFDVGNVLNYEAPEGLPADTEIFVSIVPYNDIGNAINCREESFITTSVVVDCGPYYDYLTGTSITLSPDINFPKRIGFCVRSPSTRISSDDDADGYRWFMVNSDGSETLISSEKIADIPKIGTYRYEAYNNIEQSTTTVECGKSVIFQVLPSDSATIHSIEDHRRSNGQVAIIAEGQGLYEFALDSRSGPYQDSSVFHNVTNDFHKVFVRDKNGCGITESSIQRKLTSDDFPKFFTPNGDNVNDHWQFITPKLQGEITVTSIHIFNRYGNLLTIIDPNLKGWDGTFKGSPLPASDYWFRAYAENGEEIRGHFTLKR